MKNHDISRNRVNTKYIFSLNKREGQNVEE